MGLMPKPTPPLIIKGFKSEGLLLDTGYHVPLRTKDGDTHSLLAYSVDKIVTDVNSSLDREAAAAFPQVEWEAVRGVARRVDLLLGFDIMGCFPVKADRKDSLALWSSQLGTGWMIAGQPQLSCMCESCTCMVVVNMVGAEHFQPLDFSRAEHWAPTCQPAVQPATTVGSASSGRTPSASRRTRSTRSSSMG